VVSVERRVVDDPADACAELLLQVARGGGDIVMTGGSTPRAAYQAAARDPDAWTRPRVWFGDERCVPPEDERSNYGMFADALLARLGSASERVDVRRIEGELGPEEGASRYEESLRDAGRPGFELLLLGLGPDGHVASLFPGQPTLGERERWVVAVPEAGFEPYVPRVSFSLAAIAAARHVLFLVSGEAKAGVVASVFADDVQPTERLPATLVPTVNDRVTLLCDPAAASGL
jgi:6-phosphogluconolactonase